VRSEVGTPNSATPPQGTCCRLPEDGTGQIQADGGKQMRDHGKEVEGSTIDNDRAP
jgi:hypothetical protein